LIEELEELAAAEKEAEEKAEQEPNATPVEEETSNGE